MPLITNNIQIANNSANLVAVPIPAPPKRKPHNKDFIDEVNFAVTNSNGHIWNNKIDPVANLESNTVLSSSKPEKVIKIEEPKPPVVVPKKKEDELPSLEEITQVPDFLKAKELKETNTPGYIMVDGIPRKIEKSSQYMLDNISLV